MFGIKSPTVCSLADKIYMMNYYRNLYSMYGNIRVMITTTKIYITCIRPCYSCTIWSSNIKNNILNVAYIYKDELGSFISIR